MSSDNIEYREENDGVTYIAGKQVSTAWKFVSNGTWYDKGAEVKLEADCCWWGGDFRGTRTSQYDYEANCGHPLGTKYEDGELCMWEEFDIYDENGILLRKADLLEETEDGVKLIGVKP